MTDPVPLSEPPAARPAPPRRRLLLVALAVLLVAGAGVGVAAALGAFTPTFTLTGTLTLPTRAIVTGSLDVPEGSPCGVGDGYSDISAGTAVLVANAQGQTIATGELMPGRITLTGDGTNRVTGCAFAFAVPDVPDGLASYAVTVSHRGTQVILQSEAHSGLTLTLGTN